MRRAASGAKDEIRTELNTFKSGKKSLSHHQQVHQNKSNKNKRRDRSIERTRARFACLAWAVQATKAIVRRDRSNERVRGLPGLGGAGNKNT